MLSRSEVHVYSPGDAQAGLGLCVALFWWELNILKLHFSTSNTVDHYRVGIDEQIETAFSPKYYR